MNSTNICEVPLDLFSSSPEAARELIANLSPTTNPFKDANCWLTLIEIANNKVLKFCLTEKNVFFAESWFSIISELAEKLDRTPIEIDTRQSMQCAASALIFFHGVDHEKKFRNPSWWVGEFLIRYDRMFEEVFSILKKECSECDFIAFQEAMGELNSAITMAKYPLKEEVKNQFKKWIDLWNFAKTVKYE